MNEVLVAAGAFSLRQKTPGGSATAGAVAEPATRVGLAAQPAPRLQPTPTRPAGVDEDVAESLEYLYAGDTALVTMQCSYLPSWLSFMVDKSKATEAASALIGAVHAEWAALPADSRPKLVLFGESLGSYGTETTSETSRAWQPAPMALCSSGHRSRTRSGESWWTNATQEPRCVWHPVYDDGKEVLFVQDAAELRSPSDPPEVPKVMYLQNSSDPVV